MKKNIFLVDNEPFAARPPEEGADWFIYPRQLEEERDDVWITTDLVRFPRELYTAFNTRDEALLHLERIALNKAQELEEELNKWRQFTRSVEVEIMK